MKNYLLWASLILNVLFLASAVFAVQRAGGIRLVMNKIRNPGLAGTYEHRVNLFEMLPNDEGEIIFLGNSLTAQNEWAEMFGNPKIKNRGIAGDHSVGVLARLNEVLESRPSKIFLMIGINDLAYHPPATTLKNIERLVTTILEKAPSTSLYLQSVLPVNNSVRPTLIENEDILELNEGLKKLALDKGVAFIDLYPLLSDPEGNLDAAYTKDGIHLNGLAYLKWKAAIEQEVRSE